jgi:uncharacterized repeat protein (TIGR03803 family)
MNITSIFAIRMERTLDSGSRWMQPLACALLFMLLFVLAAAPAHAQFVYSSLYEFNCGYSSGCFPEDVGQLTVWSDGNLYGTASSGGSYLCGTIFNATASGGYSDDFPFDPYSVVKSPTQQCFPQTALTPASVPNTMPPQTYLYGTTSYGQVHATLFRYNPGDGTIKVLHALPKPDDLKAPPVVGKDGNLYGVTNNGVAYQINATTGTYKQLSTTAMVSPRGPLFLASNGNLYGETCNAIFSMTTTGTINTVYTMSSSSDCPAGGLTQANGASGNLLYGVAQNGGTGGNGYIFEVSITGTGFMHLYDFSPFSGIPDTNADGANPVAGLLAATDGNLYGTAEFGGLNGLGTIFELIPSGSSWSFVHIFDFSGTSGAVLGANPLSGLVQHPNGSFYGVTNSGGISAPPIDSAGQGVLYGLKPYNPIATLTLCCSNFVILDQPVQIYGVGLYEVTSVTFAGVTAQFQSISPTYVTAQVPAAAVDGPAVVTAINPASGQQETFQSQQTLHIMPAIINLDPARGAVGTQVNIVGGGFASATEVTFGGVPATSFSVQAPNLILVTVPAGAKSGKMTVTTPNGSAKSKKTFTVN